MSKVQLVQLYYSAAAFFATGIGIQYHSLGKWFALMGAAGLIHVVAVLASGELDKGVDKGSS